MSFEREIADIYRLKVPFDNIYTSVFLIKTESGNILVDCATTKQDVDEWIVPALAQAELSVTDIKYLVLTHKHRDHAGGKERLLALNPSLEIIDELRENFANGLTMYEMKGHTLDCVGVFDERSGTLISGDGLQGYGVGKYRSSLKSKEEYAKTIERIRQDKRVKNILFSHAYEPWERCGVFGREEVEKCLLSCEEVMESKPYISILGDSISTFEGYSNNPKRNTTTQNNKVYYGGEGNTGSKYPFRVEDCWWYKSANAAGLRVLVNNAWSGDRVARFGLTRCEQLHSDVLNLNPDVIAVYIGTNDYNHKLSVEDFYKYYSTMVEKIKKKYQAKVFLFTLTPNGRCIKYGRSLEELPLFNQQIKAVAKQYDCTVVDLYTHSGITEENYLQYTFDGDLHPNVQGHDMIANCFIKTIKGEI